MTEEEWEQREREARRKARQEKVLDAALLGIMVVLGLGLILVGWYYLP